ncbi:MAG TPA: hypothetical protein VFJ85_17015 [Acidimicrobiales bacterium]|nr:hypothetical protein [Acidimicrobiales bacterium]
MFTLVAVAAVVVAAGACGGAGSDHPPAAGAASTRLGQVGILRPFGGPEKVQTTPDEFEPLDKIPAGFVVVRGEGFTLRAPSGFVRKDGTSTEGEPLLALTGPGTGGVTGAGGTRPLVGVLRDTKQGRTSVFEQSRVLATTKELTAKATGIRRTVVAWPGVRDAVLLEWTEDQRTTDGGTQAVHSAQLFTDVDDGLSLTVFATAPADAFDRSQVVTILRTFRPERRSS